MKKTYIIPDMETVVIQTTQVLAASLPVNSETQIESTDILAPELPGIPPFVFEIE